MSRPPFVRLGNTDEFSVAKHIEVSSALGVEKVPAE